MQGVLALPFDDNIMRREVSGEMLLADIVFGDDMMCNSNVRRGDIAGEMTLHAMVTLLGEMLTRVTS